MFSFAKFRINYMIMAYQNLKIYQDNLKKDKSKDNKQMAYLQKELLQIPLTIYLKIMYNKLKKELSLRILIMMNNKKYSILSIKQKKEGHLQNKGGTKKTLYSINS